MSLRNIPFATGEWRLQFRDTLQFLLPGLLTLYSPQYVGVAAPGQSRTLRSVDAGMVTAYVTAFWSS